jgi:DsbC/DsbD-like thiol-disulfide interchange protein
MPMIGKASRLGPIFAVLAAVFSYGGGPQPAIAASSAWHEAAHTRLRLISAGVMSYQGRQWVVAGVEIVLDGGWMTYWRSPGDGVAPSLDWSGSANLKALKVLWPAPFRFKEPGGLISIGYKDRVILPMLITPQEESAPVRLVIGFNYGVCADICIPVEAMLRFEITRPDDELHREALRSALDAVPKLQAQGVYCPHRLIAVGERIVKGKPALVIKTAFSDQATGLDLFAEAAPDGVALPVPTRQPSSTRGRSHYLIAFATAKAAKAFKGQTLNLTAVSDQGSCETTWRME